MWKQFLAEFLGTFILVLAILSSGGQALTIGLALALAIYLIGSVSGGHLNPAVSLTMLANKSINTNTAIYYIIAQIVGGLVAYVFYKKVVEKEKNTTI